MTFYENHETTSAKELEQAKALFSSPKPRNLFKNEGKYSRKTPIFALNAGLKAAPRIGKAAEQIYISSRLTITGRNLQGLAEICDFLTWTLSKTARQAISLFFLSFWEISGPYDFQGIEKAKREIDLGSAKAIRRAARKAAKKEARKQAKAGRKWPKNQPKGQKAESQEEQRRFVKMSLAEADKLETMKAEAQKGANELINEILSLLIRHFKAIIEKAKRGHFPHALPKKPQQRKRLSIGRIKRAEARQASELNTA